MHLQVFLKITIQYSREMYVSIAPSTRKYKKYAAVFYDKDRKKVKTVHIGDSRYKDYTQGTSEEQRNAYINRHQKNEDWNDYMSAGSLSRFILWEYKDFDKAVREYRKKFNLKTY